MNKGAPIGPPAIPMPSSRRRSLRPAVARGGADEVDVLGLDEGPEPLGDLGELLSHAPILPGVLRERTAPSQGVCEGRLGP